MPNYRRKPDPKIIVAEQTPVEKELTSREGPSTARAGDFVINDDEFQYPCDPIQFGAKFELADN